MYPFDNSFNELHIREKIIVFGGHLMWLNDCVQNETNLKIQNDIINRILELAEVVKCLEYYLDYERSVSKKFNETSLEFSKIRLENEQLKQKIKNYEKSLDNAAENL